MRTVPVEEVRQELNRFLNIINDNNKNATQLEGARSLALIGFKEFLKESFKENFPADKDIDLADAMKFLKEKYPELTASINQVINSALTAPAAPAPITHDDHAQEKFSHEQVDAVVQLSAVVDPFKFFVTTVSREVDVPVGEQRDDTNTDESSRADDDVDRTVMAEPAKPAVATDQASDGWESVSDAKEFKKETKEIPATVRYHFNKDGTPPALIILHKTVDVIGASKSEDAEVRARVLKEIGEATTKLLASDTFKNITDIKIQHIIPEVGRGISERHIRLRVIDQKQEEKFADSYVNKTKSQLFDPRAFGLGAQNTFDDTNCGRYVAAMSIQAAGLARDGLPVTKENLKVSPSVHRALHFNSQKDAQKGLEYAYVKPLSKNPKPQEIIDHNMQKIQCLKAEYESRRTNVHREYHGTKISPFGGGYGTATFFTRKLGYSATEKLEAVKEIEKGFEMIGKRQDAVFDPSKFQKAARQGELGKCLNAIVGAQKEIARKAAKESDKTNQFANR